MKKSQSAMLLIFIILVSSVGFSSVSAVSNLASIYGKTYPFQVDNKTYNIYYGFNVTYATVTNISLLPEHKSMQISLNKVKETDAMWIQFPQNLISAENNNFVLYVDGQEKRYELATSGHSTIMGFMVPANVTFVEIRGTNVVPEFPFAVITLVISFVALILLTRIK